MPSVTNEALRIPGRSRAGVPSRRRARAPVLTSAAKKKPKVQVRKIKSLNRKGTISIKRLRAAVKAVAMAERAAAAR